MSLSICSFVEEVSLFPCLCDRITGVYRHHVWDTAHRLSRNTETLEWILLGGDIIAPICDSLRKWSNLNWNFYKPVNYLG